MQASTPNGCCIRIGPLPFFPSAQIPLALRPFFCYIVRTFVAEREAEFIPLLRFSVELRRQKRGAALPRAGWRLKGRVLPDRITLSAGSSSRNDFLFALTARYSLFVRGCRQIASPSTDCSLIGLLGKASASPGQLKERLLVLERKAADATHCLDQSMDYRSQTPR
jgi:hypothetical protein